MADPTSLLIADAAARAVEFVGLPEAQLNLAQAVVHLSTAPKSNRVTLALTTAMQDISSAGEGRVPPHLRDAHYSGASGIGHGEGYEYPHNYPKGWIEQKYRPAEVESNMINPSSPLVDFSKCYENSVPNHSVLVKSLQHSEELRILNINGLKPLATYLVIMVLD